MLGLGLGLAGQVLALALADAVKLLGLTMIAHHLLTVQ